MINTRKMRKLYRHPILFVKDSQAKKVIESRVSPRIASSKLLLGIVVLPFLLSVFYYTLIASDKFSSESTIIVRTIGSQDQVAFGLPFVTGNSESFSDAMIVQEYILSMTMYQKLKSDLHIDKHYSSNDVDYLSAMARESAIEDQLEYFRDQVAVTFDEGSGVLTVEAKAFEPAIAQQIVKHIIDQSEDFINNISTSLSSEQYAFVNGELERAQTKLKAAKEKINQFSQKHNIVNPESESMAMTAVVNELKAELTKEEAELKTLLGYMNPQAPEVHRIKNRIAAIKQQLEKESMGYTEDDNASLSQLRSKYHELTLEFEFAQDAYKTALATLEKVRVDSYQKKKYLVRLSEPYLPEYPKYPKKIKNLLGILLALFLVFGTVTLVSEIIKENME